MHDLGFLMLLTIWSAGTGLAVVRRLAPVPDHPTDAMALAVPTGLGALSLATLGLGTAGWLTPAGLAGILAVGVLVILFDRSWTCIPWPADRESSEEMLRARSEYQPGSRWVDRAFDLALSGVILGTLLTAMAPVTDGDALCYHLQVPKLFLWNHATRYEPDLHETVYPLVVEMLYAVALAFRGPVACRLIQWLFGLVLAASVTSMARPVLGRRARWAGTIALLVPAISNGMGAPLNDVALAAMGNATLFAWLRWRERPTSGAAALTGLLAGLTLGVKYPAIVWDGLLGLAMLGACLSTSRNRLRNDSQVKANGVSVHTQTHLWRHVVIFSATLLLTGSWWYLRAYRATGNPVHPFFRHLFGSGIDEVLASEFRPLPVTLFHLLTALAPMTLQPDRFDSYSHQFGPVFLLCLPALLVIRSPRRVWGIAALAYTFLMLCLTQRQSMRFVLIAVGPWSVAAAWLISYCWKQQSVLGRVMVGALLLVLAFESAWALARARHGILVVIGKESSEAYLSRREPTYRVGRWIAANLPASARIVGQDHRGFYIPRPYSMELAHRRRTGLGRHGESATEIIAHFRAEGFTHLLLCPPVPETAVEFDPTLGRLLAPWLAQQAPLFEQSIIDADRVMRHYALYDLRSEARMADAGRESR